jgi:3-oxoacyl-[acyl-carrier protein] reductase
MILLIGGSSGIGKKILPKLLKIDNVIATYNKTGISNLSINKNKLIKLKLNISSEKSILSFIKKNKKYLKNIVCINLSALTLDRLLVDISKKELTDIFSVNVFSNFYLAKHLVPIMISQNYGKFIFFSSSKAEKGDVGISAYSSSKLCLRSLSKSIVNEYSRFGITSNLISLGYFDTKLWKRLSKKKKKELILEIPTKKLGNINDISNIIISIIKSEFLNGSTIAIDGGI